jgi:hypothetical protein
MGGGHVGWKWWKWWKQVIVLNQPGQIGAVIGNHVVDMLLMGCRREGQQGKDTITMQQGQEGHLTTHACDHVMIDDTACGFCVDMLSFRSGLEWDTHTQQTRQDRRDKTKKTSKTSKETSQVVVVEFVELCRILSHHTISLSPSCSAPLHLSTTY